MGGGRLCRPPPMVFKAVDLNPCSFCIRLCLCRVTVLVSVPVTAYGLALCHAAHRFAGLGINPKSPVA